MKALKSTDVFDVFHLPNHPALPAALPRLPAMVTALPGEALLQLRQHHWRQVLRKAKVPLPESAERC